MLWFAVLTLYVVLLVVPFVFTITLGIVGGWMREREMERTLEGLRSVSASKPS